MASGRLLGIDFGHVRVGLAVSDADRRITSPLLTYHRRLPDQDRAFFEKVLGDEDINQIVIGLPLHLNGREGLKAVEARRFGEWFKSWSAIPIVFWDERFTTVEAENYLLAAGMTNKRRKARRDKLAAQIMLQAYVDAGCPLETIGGPLADPPVS